MAVATRSKGMVLSIRLVGMNGTAPAPKKLPIGGEGLTKEPF